MCFFCRISRIVPVTLKLRFFLFVLWYICRENDDLMVFQIQCYGGITRVREEEEEEECGSLSENELDINENRERGAGTREMELRGFHLAANQETV